MKFQSSPSLRSLVAFTLLSMSVAIAKADIQIESESIRGQFLTKSFTFLASSPILGSCRENNGLGQFQKNDSSLASSSSITCTIPALKISDIQAAQLVGQLGISIQFELGQLNQYAKEAMVGENIYINTKTIVDEGRDELSMELKVSCVIGRGNCTSKNLNKSLKIVSEKQIQNGRTRAFAYLNQVEAYRPKLVCGYDGCYYEYKKECDYNGCRDIIPMCAVYNGSSEVPCL